MGDSVNPLIFPVRWQEDKILVLDETLLPFKEKYLEVSGLEDALFCLKEMKTRAFGQVLLYFYTCALLEKEYKDKKILASLLAKKFKSIRPTFDFFYLAGMLHKSIDSGMDIAFAVDNFVNYFDGFRKRRCALLAKELPKKASILTVCNVNGEFIYLYRAMISQGKQCVFYVSETRPYLQGSRLTFWELRREGIEARLVCDNQIASLMRDNIINAVVTGADRVNTSGDIINKTGTYAAFVLAEHFGIPTYVFAQYPRDFDIDEVKIEERPFEEVFAHISRKDTFPDAVYPAFDVVPRKFVRGLAGESMKINENFNVNI